MKPADNHSSNFARDHLANERTYLAWLRTSVNVIVLGLVVAKFVEGESRGEVAGAVLIGVGFLLLAYGTHRSRRLTADLDAGRFSVDYKGPLVMTAAVAVAVATAITLLFG